MSAADRLPADLARAALGAESEAPAVEAGRLQLANELLDHAVLTCNKASATADAHFASAMAPHTPGRTVQTLSQLIDMVMVQLQGLRELQIALLRSGLGYHAASLDACISRADDGMAAQVRTLRHEAVMRIAREARAMPSEAAPRQARGRVVPCARGAAH